MASALFLNDDNYSDFIILLQGRKPHRFLRHLPAAHLISLERPVRHDVKRIADCGMLRVVAFADPQQDIAVKQTSITLRHQS
jgi:hypothetical protein